MRIRILLGVLSKCAHYTSKCKKTRDSSILISHEVNESFQHALKDVCVHAIERLIDRARLGTREDVDNELALIEATLLALPREDTELVEHVRFENNTYVCKTIQSIYRFTEMVLGTVKELRSHPRVNLLKTWKIQYLCSLAFIVMSRIIGNLSVEEYESASKKR